MDIFKVVSLGVAVTALLAIARPDVVDAQNVSQGVSQQQLPAVDMSAPTAEPALAVEPTPVADDERAPVADPVADDESNDVVTPAPGDVVVHETRDRHGRKVVKTVHIVHVGRVNHAQIQAAMEEAHRAEAEIARIQPEIDRAIAAAKIDEKTARALEKVEPQIRAEVARAIARAQPAIRAAMAQVRASANEMRAAARAHARAVVRIEKDTDEASEHDEDANDDADNDDNAGDDHDEAEPEDKDNDSGDETPDHQ